MNNFEQHLLATIGNDVLFFAISWVTSVLTGYILLRERLVKTEMKLENLYEYFNNRNELLDNKIKDLQNNLEETKAVNKEVTKKLNENTQSVNELKIILNVVNERLQKNI